jgi:dephospho-CoA kinase
MLKVGITGGIGSGKTHVTKMFKHYATINSKIIPVYYSDERSKYLLNHDLSLKDRIYEAFGKASYLNGELNSKYLASKVFSDPIELKKLNDIAHPAVENDFNIWCKGYQSKNIKYVLKESAILFESGLHRKMDKNILVYAPLEIRIKRIKNRDPQRTEEDILDILTRQMKESDKKNLADYIIANDESDNNVLDHIAKIDKYLSDWSVLNKNLKGLNL